MSTSLHGLLVSSLSDVRELLRIAEEALTSAQPCVACRRIGIPAHGNEDPRQSLQRTSDQRLSNSTAGQRFSDFFSCPGFRVCMSVVAEILKTHVSSAGSGGVSSAAKGRRRWVRLAGSRKYRARVAADLKLEEKALAQLRLVFTANEENPRPRRSPGWSPGGARSVKARNLSRSGGRGLEYNVDSSLCSNSRMLELDYGCSCQFFCGCEHECLGHDTDQCLCSVGCGNPTCQFRYFWIAVIP